MEKQNGFCQYIVKNKLGPLVIQLMWYILKQLFTSVSVKVVDINLASSRLGKYPPLFSSTLVNKYRSEERRVGKECNNYSPKWR